MRSHVSHSSDVVRGELVALHIGADLDVIDHSGCLAIAVFKAGDIGDLDLVHREVDYVLAMEA